MQFLILAYFTKQLLPYNANLGLPRFKANQDSCLFLMAVKSKIFETITAYGVESETAIQEQPPEVFSKKGVLKNFAISMTIIFITILSQENICVGGFF